MGLRVCQRKGCISSLPPKFQILVNLKEKDLSDLGQLESAALVCEQCKSELTVEKIFTVDNWINLHIQAKIIRMGNIKTSTLSYREIKISR